MTKSITCLCKYLRYQRLFSLQSKNQHSLKFVGLQTQHKKIVLQMLFHLACGSLHSSSMTFLKLFNYSLITSNVIFLSICMKSYKLIFLKLCDAKLEFFSSISFGFKNLDAQTKNGKNTCMAY